MNSQESSVSLSAFIKQRVLSKTTSPGPVTNAVSQEHQKEKFHCLFCERVYSTAASLSTHKSNKHRNEARQKRRPPSKQRPPVKGGNHTCGLCQSNYQTQIDLCYHLQMTEDNGGHGLGISIQEKEFPDKESFQRWRQTVEADGRFNFIIRGRMRLKTGVNQYLRCHRSGMYSSVAVRRAPSQKGSKKAGFHCSAFANVTFHQDGSVSAEFCVDHYGHDALVSRCRIPQEVVVEVCRLLRMDFTHKQVLDIVRREEETERRHSLTLANIVNIARAAGITAKRKSKTKNSKAKRRLKNLDSKRKSKDLNLETLETPELSGSEVMGEKRRRIRSAWEFVDWGLETVQNLGLLEEIQRRMLSVGRLVESAQEPPMSASLEPSPFDYHLRLGRP